MLQRAPQNTDPLHSFRLITVLHQHPDSRPVQPVKLPVAIKDLELILNIYPLYQDGMFYLVFESIARNVKAKPARSYIKSDHDVIAASFIMIEDGDVYFDADCQGSAAQYCTNACAMELSSNNFQALMELADIMKAAVKTDNGATVVVSGASILQCFQEAVCSYQPLLSLERKERQIVNPLPVSIETFIYQPQHKLDTEKCLDVLFDALSSLPELSDYTELASYLQRWRSCGNSIDCLEKETQLPFRQLLDDSVTQYEKESIATRIDLYLNKNHKNGLIANYLAFLLNAFNKQALLSFVIGFNHHRCSRGYEYNIGSPEISFLLHAEFNALEDGRIYIDVTKNNAYQADFAANKPHANEVMDMLTHLFSCLNIRLDRDSDRSHMLIFTMDTSRLLRARGLHFHEHYWDKKLKPRSLLQELLGSSSGLFLNKVQLSHSEQPVERFTNN